MGGGGSCTFKLYIVFGAIIVQHQLYLLGFSYSCVAS